MTLISLASVKSIVRLDEITEVVVPLFKGEYKLIVIECGQKRES
jgi:hypothetical protein